MNSKSSIIRRVYKRGEKFPYEQRLTMGEPQYGNCCHLLWLEKDSLPQPWQWSEVMQNNCPSWLLQKLTLCWPEPGCYPPLILYQLHHTQILHLQLLCSQLITRCVRSFWLVYMKQSILTVHTVTVSFSSQCFKIQYYRLFSHKNQIPLRYT